MGAVVKIGSLFSGIGGLELGLEWAGLGETIWQVEQSEFCRAVLAKHWPDAERFEDVREVGAANLVSPDLICGGYPCQDVSSAGKGAGLGGERSGLWFEFARIVGELRPTWVVVENVASGAQRWVDTICADLGRRGYAVLPIPLSAADVGAPHRRERIFVVAYAVGDIVREQQQRQPRRRAGGIRDEGQAESVDDGSTGASANSDRDRKPSQPRFDEMASEPTSSSPGDGDATDSGGSVVEGQRQPSRTRALVVDSCRAWSEGPTQPPVCGVDDGVPQRVARLRALGNAVVPQCAEVIGWVIREIIEQRGSV